MNQQLRAGQLQLKELQKNPSQAQKVEVHVEIVPYTEVSFVQSTMNPPIKDTPTRTSLLTNRTKSAVVDSLHTKYPLKEDNLSTKDKRLGLKHVHYLEVPLHSNSLCYLKNENIANFDCDRHNC